VDLCDEIGSFGVGVSTASGSDRVRDQQPPCNFHYLTLMRSWAYSNVERH
jgi:hypothetical protein